MENKISVLFLNPLKENLQESITNVSPNITLTVVKPEEAEPYLADATVLVTWGQMNIDEWLPKMSRLKWIHALSAGVDQLLSPAVIDTKIPVTNSKGIHGIPISEYIFANLLAFYRNLFVLEAQQKEKIWKRPMSEELFDKTIGIIGLGAIGREVAKRAKAFGLEVFACKKTATDELFIDKLFLESQMDEMLPQCDIVVLALPLTPETEHSFAKERFQLMKNDSCLVNISRGQIICDADLIKALESGEIRHAFLDVFEEEPLPESSPLWTMPQITITPHIAALTPHYMDRAVQVFTTNLERFESEAPLLNLMDPKKGY